MTQKPETRLVLRIIKAIEASYPSAWVIKMHGDPYGEGGIPDIVACIEGRLYGLEVKLQGPGETRAHAIDRTTERQSKHIARIINAGGAAGTVLSVDDALDLIVGT